jgi:HEAT repeat protein
MTEGFGMEEPYEFRDSDLDSSNAEIRRAAIIFISKQRLQQFENALLKMLATEPTYSNRRHIVRALGNLGSQKSVPTLLSCLDARQDLVVGDAAEALGKLKVTEAISRLQCLSDSPVEWIANKSRWALREIQSHTQKN